MSAFGVFGRGNWRKVVPCVCIVDGRRHIRKFREEALEERGFTTRVTQVGELSVVLDGQALDLVSGLLPGCLDFCTIREASGAM